MHPINLNFPSMESQGVINQREDVDKLLEEAFVSVHFVRRAARCFKPFKWMAASVQVSDQYGFAVAR